jgi:hypothetical protein
MTLDFVGAASWDPDADDTLELEASETSRRSCAEAVTERGLNSDGASDREGVMGSVIGSERSVVVVAGSLFVPTVATGLKKSVTFLLLFGFGGGIVGRC